MSSIKGNTRTKFHLPVHIPFFNYIELIKIEGLAEVPLNVSNLEDMLSTEKVFFFLSCIRTQK